MVVREKEALESSINHIDSKKSRIWYENFSILFWLFSEQENLLFMEWFYFVFFLCRCRCWSRIGTIFHFIYPFYCSDFLYLWKKNKKSKDFCFFLLFVDNGLFILWEKSFANTNANILFSYNIMSSLLDQFGLVVKYEKTEIFYFSRSYGIFNSPALDLSQIGGPILCPKDMWQYLRFIFD